MKIFIFVVLLAISQSFGDVLPTQYDSRDVSGTSYVTAVKSQTGGTCWTHGTMAAIESELLRSGQWTALGHSEDPNLSEYHLDWHNGFNEYYNADGDPTTGYGLGIHYGGDYRVASAYMSRGGGVVPERFSNEYTYTPSRWLDDLGLYPRHIEWLTAGPSSNRVETIKQAIVDHGAVATCMYYNSAFLDSRYVFVDLVGYVRQYFHYQPSSSNLDPNHSIAIIGWDDSILFEDEGIQPGAWLCKNSWGSSWGDDGTFWISYYDKHCGKEAEMGAVVFRDIVPYDQWENTTDANWHFYYHDYHGWRDTMSNRSTAMNAFTATADESIKAVSFFTATNDVAYQLEIFGSFDGTTLSNRVHESSGSFPVCGFHTVDLATPVTIAAGKPFYLKLHLSDGGQPYDCTSVIPVLLGPDHPETEESATEAFLAEMGKYTETATDELTVVTSRAEVAQSYYLNGTNWIDLTTFDDSANFCIKAIAQSDYDQDGCCDTADLDDDDDGMPDEWENRYGFQRKDAADAQLDKDGDQRSNYAEYMADTSPTDQTQRFELLLAQQENDVDLSFSSSTNRIYSLYRSESLAPPSWQLDQVFHNLPGNDDEMRLSMTNQNARSCYYRIEISIPEE